MDSFDDRNASSGPFPAPPAAPGPEPSLPQRFAWLWSAPRKAWTLPLAHSVWIVALIVLGVSQFGQSWLLRDLVREQMVTNIEQNDRMTEEQKTEIVARMEEGYSSDARYAGQSLLGVVTALLMMVLVPAALYLFGLNFGLGARVPFREVFAVTAFSGLITVVRDLLRTPIMLQRETLYVFVSPAALVDPNNRALVWALDRFDVFSLYRLFVLAIGLAVIARMRPQRAAIPVVAVWLLVTLVGVGFMLSPIGKLLG